MATTEFTSVIDKFDSNKGEKSGWYYLLIPSALSKKLSPGSKKSFRVKGFIDNHQINRVALLPDGNGNFIMPLNQQIRKSTGKTAGEKVHLKIEVDESEYIPDADLMNCLDDDADAKKYFFSLSPSHRNYFSKWIESAKTNSTKEKRLVMTMNALSEKMGFPDMLRAQKSRK